MTQRNKRVLVLVLSIFVVLGWAFALFDIIEDHLSALLGLSILIPAMISGYVMWLLRDIVPKDRIDFIRALSREIGENAKGDLNLIPQNDVPEEILPLVRRLNQMITFQRDRYEQERDFTAHASHELRTPLAGIRLQTELAMATKDPAQREKAHQYVLKAIDRSTRLVEQLLTLSRLTADRAELATEAVDLVPLTYRVMDELKDLAETEKVKIIFDKKLEKAVIRASEESVAILLNNLVRNALVYTPEGGLVTLRVEKARDTASLVVTDTGPGIDVDQREIVLKRFQKAKKENKTGTGLGLAIVKRIVDLHHGKLELLEGADEKGLLVRVSFPTA